MVGVLTYDAIFTKNNNEYLIPTIKSITTIIVVPLVYYSTTNVGHSIDISKQKCILLALH